MHTIFAREESTAVWAPCHALHSPTKGSKPKDIMLAVEVSRGEATGIFAAIAASGVR